MVFFHPLLSRFLPVSAHPSDATSEILEEKNIFQFSRLTSPPILGIIPRVFTLPEDVGSPDCQGGEMADAADSKSAAR